MRAPNRFSDNRTLKAMQHLVSTTTPTLFESRYKQEGPSVATDSVVSAGLQGTASALRIHTTTAEAALPHMNMSQDSPIVQSRGTSITVKRLDSPTRAYTSTYTLSGSPSASVPYKGLAGEDVRETSSPIKTGGTYDEPSIALFTGFARGNAASGDTVHSTSELSSKRGYIRSSSPLSFNANRVREPKTTGNKSYSNSLTGRLEKRNKEKLGRIYSMDQWEE